MLLLHQLRFTVYIIIFTLVFFRESSTSEAFIVCSQAIHHGAPISVATTSNIVMSDMTRGREVPARAGSASDAVVGKSNISITNTEEGYHLNGLLTVKNAESRSLWVLCHGLCSSLEGTVPRFVSEKLDANTLRSDPNTLQVLEQCLNINMHFAQVSIWCSRTRDLLADNSSPSMESLRVGGRHWNKKQVLLIVNRDATHNFVSSEHYKVKSRLCGGCC